MVFKDTQEMIKFYRSKPIDLREEQKKVDAEKEEEKPKRGKKAKDG